MNWQKEPKNTFDGKEYIIDCPEEQKGKPKQGKKFEEEVCQMTAIRKEAFEKLEQLHKKGTLTDYDAELASYREEKYGK